MVNESGSWLGLVLMEGTMMDVRWIPADAKFGVRPGLVDITKEDKEEGSLT